MRTQKFEYTQKIFKHKCALWWYETLLTGKCDMLVILHLAINITAQ